MFAKLKAQVAERLRGSTIARGATTAFAVRVYGAVLAYAIQILLARTIGAEQLGVYVFCWTWLSIAAFLTPLGFDTSMVRFVAAFAARGDWRAVRGVLASGRLVAVTVSLAVVLLGVTVVRLVDSGGQSQYGSALTIALCAIPVVALINVYEGIARGFNWIHQVAVPSFVFESDAETYDFLTPATDFKRTLSDSMPAVSYYAVPLSLRGHLYREAYLRRARPVLKWAFHAVCRRREQARSTARRRAGRRAG